MNKVYPITTSCLYQLRNKKKLESYLNLSPSFFTKENMKSILKYHKSNITDKKGKSRDILLPSKELKNAQRNLTRLLSRIETPSYLISGKKGKCYVDNSKFHINQDFVLTIDISKYYPSCKKEYVYNFFTNKLKTSVDIATILTKLTTYNNTVPTGVSTSQLISFWSYYEMFEEINAYANKENLKFSLYVDDMTFSSKNTIPSDFIRSIKKILKKYNFYTSDKKIKFFNKNEPKFITGAYLSKDGSKIFVPNKLRYKIINDFKLVNLQLEKNNYISKDSYLRIIGLINASRQIEPEIFPEIYNKLIKIKNNNKIL